MSQQIDLSDLPAAAPPPRRSLDLSDLPSAGEPAESSAWDRVKELAVGAADTVIPLGLRIGGAIAGGLAGGAAGLAAGGVGAIPGAIAGGAAGSALGETAAEGYEVMRGSRESLNPTQIAVQGVLGAVPVVGRAPTVARAVLSRGAQGAVLGGVSDVATKMAEGDDPTLGSVALATGAGAVLGGGFGALEGRAAQRAARAVAPKLDLSDLPAAGNTPAVGKWGTYNGKDLTEAEFLARQAQLNLDAAGKPVNGGAVDSGGLLPKDADLGDPNLKAAPMPVREPNTAEVATPAAVDPDKRLLAHERRTTGQIETIAKVSGEPIPAAKSIEPAKINPAHIADTLPEETRAGVLKIMDEHAGFAAQRRDVQPVERTRALAEYIQTDRARALPKGTALNAEQSMAYAGALDSVQTKIDDLSTKVAKGDASAWDVAALDKARREAVILTASWRGAKAEAGRALNIHRYTDEVLKSHDEISVKAIEQALKNPRLRDNIDQFAKDWAALGGDRIKQVQYIRSKQEASVMDTLSSVFYSGILSGARTHIRNVLGNTANQAFIAASKGGAVVYDASRSALTGKDRTIFLSEMKPAAVGAWVGLKQGMDDFVFTMRHGFGRTTLDTFDVPRVELRGGGANPLNWTGRLLEAEDQFFRSVAYHQEKASRIYASARQEAMKKGLRGQALDRQITSRSAEWSLATPKELDDAAQTAAKRAVFKEEPGGTVASIQRIKGQHPWMNFVVPFVRTPAAIIRQAVEATPFAHATAQTRAAFAAGGREASEAAGRMMAGTVALGSLAMLAIQGKISGPGPANANERAALYESGWRPNSVLLGDTWVDYTQIQPLAQALFAVTSAADLYKQGKSPDPANVLLHSLGAIVDQSFLSGASDLMNAITDADRYAQSYKEKMAGSLVPFGGMSRNVAQAIDPVVRDPKTSVEAVKTLVPGLSQTVAPKVDRFGNEVTRPGTAFERGFSPVIRSQQSQDPVILELNRLGIKNIGLPGKKLDKTEQAPEIEMTPDEQKLIGKEVRQALERIVAHAPYQKLDADRQRAVIGRVVGEARARGRAQVRAGRVRGALPAR